MFSWNWLVSSKPIREHTCYINVYMHAYILWDGTSLILLWHQAEKKRGHGNIISLTSSQNWDLNSHQHFIPVFLGGIHSRAQDCDQDGRQGPSDGFWCSEPWGWGHERQAHLTPSTPEYFFIKSSFGVRDCCCLPAPQGEYFGPIFLKNMLWRTQISTAKPPASGGHRHSPSNPSFPAAQTNLHGHQNLSTCFPTAFTTGLTSLHYNLRWSHHSVICDVLKHSLHCKNSNMSLESN